MTGGLCLGRGGASGGMGHWSQFQRISPPGGCEVTGATERKCLVRDQQSPETEGRRAGAFTGQMRVAASGRTRGRTGVDLGSPACDGGVGDTGGRRLWHIAAQGPRRGGSPASLDVHISSGV